jgi:threonine/homoserine/homoserine lactone efflux protein
MAPLGAISALGVYITYSFLFSRGLARQLYGRFTRIVDGLFGLAFAIFGCKLLKDGIEEFVRRA